MLMDKNDLNKEYKRQRKNLQNRLYRLRKKGYIIPSDIVPQIPTTITQESVEQLKRIVSKYVKKTSEFLDKDTGEIISLQTPQDFGFESSNYSPFDTDDYLPDGGEIIYNNVVNGFISKLEEPTPQIYYTTKNKLEEPSSEYGYNSYSGKRFKRPMHVQQATESAKEYLLQILLAEVEQYGKSVIGWRLQGSSDTVNFFLDRVLYGSTQDAINTATVKLASVITGGILTDSQLKALGEQSEYNEDHEEPQ